MRFLDIIELNPTISLQKGKQYPFVEMANVDFNMRSPKKFDYKPFTSGVKFEKDDTVIARIEPCLQNGKGFYVNDFAQGFGSTEYLVFRPKNQNLDSRYLYYFMQSSSIRKMMIASMSGATGRQRVNNEVFENLEVPILPLATQQKIAKILSTYDDLIENNQKQIKLLEEAAMSLYKEWFVKLRFPGHESAKIVDGVPEGWVLTNVAGICTLVKDTLNANKIKSGIPYIGLEHMPRKDICLCEWGDSAEVNSNKFMFQKDDILFGKIRPYFHKVGFALIDGIASTDAIIMRANVGTWALLLMLISSEAFVDYTYQTCKEGAKMPRADWNTMRIYPTLIADSATMNSFESMVWDYTRKIKVLALQNRALCEARDKLLPKLMNGEIEV